MSPRSVVPLSLLLGGILVLVAVVAARPPGGGATSSALPILSQEAAVATEIAPTAEATAMRRDATVAFWEARLAEGGGPETALTLADLLIERARATGDLADLQRAADVLDGVEPAPGTESAHALRRGRVAYALHDFTAARDAAQEAVDAEPTDTAALALLADVAVEMGDVAAADAAYARLVAAAPERSPAVLSRLARRAWLGGDVEDVERLADQAIDASALAATDDERAFYHFHLAEMLRARNDLNGAEAAYRAALRLQPDHVPSASGLARVLEASGERDAAIEILEAAGARVPSPDLVAALGDLYALDGRTDDAEDQWALVERIGEVGRLNGGVHDRQLVLFLADHARDPERAVALAEAELEVRADVYGHDALAWALFSAGELERAADEAERALTLGTPDGRIHYHAGLIAEALGRTEEARTHLAFAAQRSASLPPLQVPVLDAALKRVGG